jgi:TIR domain-containing protein/HEAT repeat protein
VRETKLTDFDRQEKALRILSKQLLALEDIVRETREEQNTTLGFEQLKRWKDMTIHLIAETVSESEATEMRNKHPGGFVLGQPLRNFLTEAHQYEAFLLSLNEALQKYPDRIFAHTQDSGGVLRPALTGADLFISYSSKDAEFVKKLATDLVTHGLTVWWDKWVMKVGDSLHRKIQDGITNSAWLGVVLSPNSVSSPWVEKELNSALMKELEQKEVFVLPILYKDCKIPLLLKDKLYADFRSSYELGLCALLDRFSPRVRSDLLEGLMSGSNPVVSSCYAKIRPEEHKLYGNELIKRLDSSSTQERANALTGLFVIRDAALSTHLLKMANDPADTVRQLAIFYLGELRGNYAVATISARLSDKSQEVRAAARVAYKKITGESA